MHVRGLVRRMTRRQAAVAAISRGAVVVAIVVFGLLWPRPGVPSGVQGAVSAQGSLDWPKVVLSQQVSGLEGPVHVTHAVDGSGRLFIVEQTGRIRVVQAGVLLSTPFLDLTDRVGCCGERGLLSVAFPPDYPQKGYCYVNYTDRSGSTVVARYHTMDDPNLADPGSEEVVLTIGQPYANHNGGQLAFGPGDGYLYIGMGDGGAGGDPQNHAQNPSSLLGKMLRIDVESGVVPYAIPPTNPYTQTAGYRPEIWALGLRNPWRFSFDRQTGDLYIGDVGQGQWEEIDFQAASSSGGDNYGWRIMEGAHCYDSATCDQTGLVLPVVEYDHSQGCSVTGGVVYRGESYPRMRGVYFYGDYCTGRVWGLRRNGGAWESTPLADTPFRITHFGEDEAGNVYVVDYNGGIYLIADQVVATPTHAATHTLAPTDTATRAPSPTREPTSTSTPSLRPSPTLHVTERIYLPIILKEWLD
jgi:glucose/arabinose dehydrogenase